MSLDFTSTDVRSLYVETGTMAAGAAADAEILQIRWTDTTRKLYIPYLKLNANTLGTAFTAGSANFRVAKVSAWTVDGTGGATLTLTGRLGKLDGNIAQIGVTAIPGVRVATTAALGAGTKTIDGDIAGLAVAVPATNVSYKLVEDVILVSDMSVFLRGVTLNANEGIIVRATVPATGVWNASVQFGYGVI